MAELVKKLKDVIGNAIAPYLANYMKLNGDGNLGSVSFHTIKFLSNGAGQTGKRISYHSKTNPDLLLPVIYFLGTEDLLKSIYLGGDTLTALLELNLVDKIVTVRGDLSVTGNINGTKAANLISLDDLKEVLSSDQVAKLTAKVKTRLESFQLSGNQQLMGGGGVETTS